MNDLSSLIPEEYPNRIDEDNGAFLEIPAGTIRHFNQFTSISKHKLLQLSNCSKTFLLNFNDTQNNEK